MKLLNSSKTMFLMVLATMIVGFVVVGKSTFAAFVAILFAALVAVGVFRLIFLTPTMRGPSTVPVCAASFILMIAFIFGAIKIVLSFEDRYLELGGFVLIADLACLIIGLATHQFYHRRGLRGIPITHVLLLALLSAVIAGVRVRFVPFAIELLINPPFIVAVAVVVFQVGNFLIATVFRRNSEADARRAFSKLAPGLAAADRFLSRHALGGLPELAFGPVFLAGAISLLGNAP